VRARLYFDIGHQQSSSFAVFREFLMEKNSSDDDSPLYLCFDTANRTLLLASHYSVDVTEKLKLYKQIGILKSLSDRVSRFRNVQIMKSSNRLMFTVQFKVTLKIRNFQRAS